MSTYNPVAKASFSSTSYAYSPLLSDGDDVVSRSGTVASGIGILKRGTILKCDAATGVLTVPTTAAECNCILADDIDATSATVAALVYMSGKVKADALIWPGALGHGVVSDALRDFGILVESVVSAPGLLTRAAESSPVMTPAAVTLSPTSKTGLANTSSGWDITVTSPSTDPWMPTTAESWITITAPAAPTVGNAVAHFTVASNGTAAARNGTITIGDKSFAVGQLA